MSVVTSRVNRRLFVVGAAGLAVTGIAGASRAQSDSTGGTPAASPEGSPSASPEAGVMVVIKNFLFDPAEIEIPVGTTVTWVNQDLSGHSVVADDGSFASDVLAQDDTFSFTFVQAGVVAYHCGLHVNMMGTVTVS